MIAISSALQQENIKELLNNYDGADFSYAFKEKKGIQLIFVVTGDAEKAAGKAKELIKKESWGYVLYLQVSVV